MSDGGSIQGAGNDHEGWSRGLTPQNIVEVFQALIRDKEEELLDLIKELLDEEKATQMVH